MILAGGKIHDSVRQKEILAQLETRINRVREHDRLEPELVKEALVRLGEDSAQLLSALYPDGPEHLLQRYVDALSEALRPQAIEHKMNWELGDLYPYSCRASSDYNSLSSTVMPLGTLFHIGAGNQDMLPAYSVAEGLLTGNVNILKLPGADSGLSVKLLAHLAEIQPKLADYIYVFDTPSHDREAMIQMAGMADGIVVWGSDFATEAVRRLAPPGVKLIEWGHKLGFAYISGYGRKKEELSALAGHIMSTRQLLCNSCQTVFIDTEDLADVLGFCGEFLPYLEEAAAAMPGGNPAAAGAVTLQRYNDNLERIVYGEDPGNRRIFCGRGCSLTACADMELELSGMFGNCLVKRLPRRLLIHSLRRHKGHLQTAGLICSREKRAELSQLLAGCGLTRITAPGNMSKPFLYGAHDGEYPLRRYVRIVDIENA